MIQIVHFLKNGTNKYIYLHPGGTKKEEEGRYVGWRLDSNRRNWSTLLPLNVHFLFVLTGPKPLCSTHNGDSNGGRLTGREAEEMRASVAYEVFKNVNERFQMGDEEWDGF